MYMYIVTNNVTLGCNHVAPALTECPLIFLQNTEHGAAEKVGLHQRASFGGITVRELHLTPGGGRSFWCDVCCRNGSNAKLSHRILQFRTHCRTSIGKPAGVL